LNPQPLTLFPHPGKMYNSCMDYLSFDSMASIYDESRIFDNASFNAALDYIAARYPPLKYPELYEPGIGTGRIAIPFAERGYHVTGADISTEMLKILDDKLARCRKPLPVKYIQRSITALPFADAFFNVAIAVHIFHLVKDWKIAINEAFRVLKPSSPFIIMVTGAGKEVPWVQDKYRELCAVAGHPAVNLGASGWPEIQKHILSCGRKIEIIEDRWKWVRQSSVAEAFHNIRLRHYGMTRLVSEEVHLDVVKKLEPEIIQKFGSLETVVDVPHQVRLMIITA
jgi:ubiquinone/menaquinone biosynthesis C-methylase UbiE